MVILFKGTDKSKNYSPQALALCAGLSATKYLKKTLILQLTTKYPVENYMIGKKVSEQSISDSFSFFEDTGMDSLTRRAGVTTFNADHFANATTPLVSSENLLDILEVSTKIESDVEREILQDPTVIGTIIKSAKKIYDNIFVLANGKAKDVVEQVLPYTDKTVTCVSQGIKETTSAPANEANCFLVTNYDYKSVYSLKQMQKFYNSKQIFMMPYNVEFKDYYTNKNMLQYILHNLNPEKSDYSFHLIEEMSKLTRFLIEDEEYENDDYRFTYRTFERCIQEPTVLDSDNCKIEVTEKKFLRPSKTYVHVNMEEPFEEEIPSEDEEDGTEEIELDFDIDADTKDLSRKDLKERKKRIAAKKKKEARDKKAKAKEEKALKKKEAAQKKAELKAKKKEVVARQKEKAATAKGRVRKEA